MTLPHGDGFSRPIAAALGVALVFAATIVARWLPPDTIERVVRMVGNPTRGADS